MMLDYHNELRRQLALEHAERLASDMRRSRRLTPVEAGFPSRPSLVELLRRAAHFGRAKGAEHQIPAYHS
jgi:hypothetical protein